MIVCDLGGGDGDGGGIIGTKLYTILRTFIYSTTTVSTVCTHICVVHGYVVNII